MSARRWLCWPLVTVVASCSVLSSDEEQLVDKLVAEERVVGLILLAEGAPNLSVDPDEWLDSPEARVLAVEALRTHFQEQAVTQLSSMIIEGQSADEETIARHAAVLDELEPGAGAQALKLRACTVATAVAVDSWLSVNRTGTVMLKAWRGRARHQRGDRTDTHRGPTASSRVRALKRVFDDLAEFSVTLMENPTQAWYASVDLQIQTEQYPAFAEPHAATSAMLDACGPDEPVFILYDKLVPFDQGPEVVSAELGERASCNGFEGTLCVKPDDGGLRLEANCGSDACLGDDNPLEELHRHIQAQLDLVGDEPPPGSDRTWRYSGHGVTARYTFAADPSGTHFMKSVRVEAAE